MSEETDEVSDAAPTQIPAATALEPSNELVGVLGPFRLLKGEDEDASSRLADRVRLAVAPETFIEELLARDITTVTWEILRLRRLLAELLNLRWINCLWDLAEETFDSTTAKRLERAWIRDAHPEELKKTLLRQGIDDDFINTKVLYENLHDVERFDRLIANAEGRRNSLFREIDRHRDAVQMRRLREAVTRIEDAGFEEVTTPKSEAAE